MVNPKALVGRVIADKYRVVSFIGSGSVGWVFEAREEMDGVDLGRVAIKLLPVHHDQRAKVLTEIAAMAKLRHTHVLSYMNSGYIQGGLLEGTLFIVMELAEACLAQRLVSPTGVRREECVQVATHMGVALQFLHRQGAVHRDVKPANILLVGDVWKLADFGLVRAVEGSMVTASGRKGTLRYLAPETVVEGKVGPAADMYSLGVTLLECLTGHVAHTGDTDGLFIRNLMEKEPTIPESLGSHWKRLLQGLLARDPRKRMRADDLLGADISLLAPGVHPSLPSATTSGGLESSVPAIGDAEAEPLHPPEFYTKLATIVAKLLKE